MRKVLISAHKNGLVLRVADFLLEPGADFIDVDGVVPQKHALLLVNADYKALFRDLFHGTRFGHAHLNTGLQHRRSDHEDDQQHQHDVNQRRDIDIGEGSLSSSVRSRKGHYRGTPGASAIR